MPAAPPPELEPDRKLSSAQIVSIVLSLFLPGLGHFIQGFPKRGGATVLLALATCCSFGLVNVAAALDAYCIARTTPYRTVDDWEFFPDSDRHLDA